MFQQYPQKKKYKESIPVWIKWTIVGSCLTTFISFVLGLSVGWMDLGSAVGAALQFVFWLGIGAFFHSFNADEDDWKLFRYGGVLAGLLPIVLILLIAVGGVVSYIASAIAIVLCFYLGYLQRQAK